MTIVAMLCAFVGAAGAAFWPLQAVAAALMMWAFIDGKHVSREVIAAGFTSGLMVVLAIKGGLYALELAR